MLVRRPNGCLFLAPPCSRYRADPPIRNSQFPIWANHGCVRQKGLLRLPRTPSAHYPLSSVSGPVPFPVTRPYHYTRCCRWGAPNRPGARLARKRPLQTALWTPFGRTGGARAMAAATLAVSSVASARGTKRAAWLAPSSGLEAALPLGPSSQGAVLLGFFPTCCRTQDDLWFCHSHDSGFIVMGGCTSLLGGGAGIRTPQAPPPR